GPFLDDWQGSGELSVDLALEIPLGGAGFEQVVDVEVRSNASSLAIPAQALAISEIAGDIRYHSADGLQASDLTGTLFGFPLRADIATRDTGGTRITADGKASVAALQQWQGQPAFVRGLLANFTGELEYQAQLDILG